MVLRRKVPWYVSTSLVAVVALTVSAARWPGPVPACVAAEQWVRDHLAELPTTLAQVSLYQPGLRKRIFANLPADAQRNLWREHYRAFLTAPAQRSSLERMIAGDTKLTQRQQTFLTADLDRLAIYFDTSRTLEARRAAAHLSAFKSAAVFPDSLGRAVFRTLGPSAPQIGQSSVAATGTRSGLTVRLAGLFGSKRAGVVSATSCDCYYCTNYPWDCPYPTSPDCEQCCVYFQGSGCTYMYSGCGQNGIDPCDGECLQCRSTPKKS